MSDQANIRPQFTHRLGEDWANPLMLADAIGLMTFRAKGVLELISINLEADVQASDQIVKAALSATIAEIEDIDITIQCYHDAVSGGAR
ncbi:hypothetical protein PL263_04200 [Methylomonas sp. EFPC3]|uniref:hypothetical protein n=1 Tax=Methylomonas sp. EFPC3 TaxID=3021710 RepID=UPI002417C48E|nr:hypothetical protein [Methylomonas sp. EFPC3]WFP51231.1 hypothetical protein PL263_04200 [Methylomonas sp. EFPC3]